MVSVRPMCVLGIDTSCYTTSVAVMDRAATLLLDQRRVLTVPTGQRGLRQSEALFQHIVNLPDLTRTVRETIFAQDLVSVCYSHRPRPVKSSYLPVFRAGSGLAESLAGVMGLLSVPSTHQEGHIWAGVWSSPLREPVMSALQSGEEVKMLAVHLSGGTSELGKVRFTMDGSMEIAEIGATSDLHAGQFVDRIGVALGLPFPAGPHLEELAAGVSVEHRIPSSVQGSTISFSGPASAAMRLISQGFEPAQVAAEVFDCLARTVVKWIANAADVTGWRRCLLVGGVASNQILRERIITKLRPQGIDAYFSDAAYSTDNAVGLAYLGVIQQQLGGVISTVRYR